MRHRRAHQASVSAGADRDDGTSCLGAGNQRQRHRVGAAFPMLQVDIVDPDSVVTHQHLPVGRDRVSPHHRDKLVRTGENLETVWWW